MVTINDLFKKYENSSNKWILICPTIESGQIKIRCYMNKQGKNSNTWQDCYTYEGNFEILLKILSANSYGQAYNGLLKWKQQRIGFSDETDHEKGIFTKHDIIHSMVQGRTKLLLEIVSCLQSRHDLKTNMETIKKHKTKKQLELEFETFYNY